MSLLHAFDSQEKKQMKSQILDLIRMALADGVIDDDEMNYIIELGREFSITRDEVKAIMNNPEDFHFYPPEDRLEAFERMFNLIGAMMVDGEIHENEMKLCRFYAVSLGFDQNTIEILINEIVDSLHKNEEDEIVYERINKILKSD